MPSSILDVLKNRKWCLSNLLNISHMTGRIHAQGGHDFTTLAVLWLIHTYIHTYIHTCILSQFVLEVNNEFDNHNPYVRTFSCSVQGYIFIAFRMMSCFVVDVVMDLPLKMNTGIYMDFIFLHRVSLFKRILPWTIVQLSSIKTLDNQNIYIFKMSWTNQFILNFWII